MAGLNSAVPDRGGTTTFYLGGYGAFDRLAAAAVNRQKAAYSGVEAVQVLSYLSRNLDDPGYDRTTYPLFGKVPPRYAIVKRNQWMVEGADVVVSGVAHGWGGAAKTLDFAKRKKKVIFQYPVQSGKR